MSSTVSGKATIGEKIVDGNYHTNKNGRKVFTEKGTNKSYFVGENLAKYNKTGDKVTAWESSATPKQPKT